MAASAQVVMEVSEQMELDKIADFALIITPAKTIFTPQGTLFS